MTPVDIVLMLLGAVVKLVPGFLAMFSGSATDEEALEMARAALPGPVDVEDPDPEGDAERRRRIEAADYHVDLASGRRITLASSDIDDLVRQRRRAAFGGMLPDGSYATPPADPYSPSSDE